MNRSDSDCPWDLNDIENSIWMHDLDVSNWLPSPLWKRDIDERSTKRFFALIAMHEYMEGKLSPKKFLEALQRLLGQAEDQELIGKMVQHATKEAQKQKGKRSRELHFYAQNIAGILVLEKPSATEKEVTKRVHELLAQAQGILFKGKNPMANWLKPFFKRYPKKSNRTGPLNRSFVARLR